MANNLCTDRWEVSTGYNLCTDLWSVNPVIPITPPSVHKHRQGGRYLQIWDEDLTEEEILILATYYLMRTDIEL
jgi:hypothetical protein